MSSEEDRRSKKRRRSSSRNKISKKDNIDERLNEGLFTRHGYVDDGFIVDNDSDNSYNISDNIRSNKEYDMKIYMEQFDGWKEGLSHSVIKNIEPQLKSIRSMIEEETPTIPKILEANITMDDKKRCIKLFDQLNNTEPFTGEYDKIVESINNIIRKGKIYTKQEIKILEDTEANIRSIAAPPDNIKNLILTLDANNKVKGILYGQYMEMLEHEPGSQAYNSIREELEWSLRLPHNKSHGIADLSNLSKKQLSMFYSNFLDSMNKELYGMTNIKMQMLHILNDRKSSNNSCGRNIGIVGLPGVGKTAIGKALAKVLQVPFEKISVGGLQDASILTGSDKVWNSASPSIILQVLARLQSSSPVIIIDEADKMDLKSQYAMLHISDYVHNNEFRDNYLNKYPHDLSKVFFIYTMNSTDNIDPALLSRMDIVEAVPYTDAEKKIILQDYVLPRALSDVGLDRKSVTIDDTAANKLVLATRQDPGVREIEKVVKCLVGKINMYNSIVSKDGTTGDVQLNYEIPNFKLPMKIGTKLLVELTKEKVKY